MNHPMNLFDEVGGRERDPSTGVSVEVERYRPRDSVTQNPLVNRPENQQAM